MTTLETPAALPLPLIPLGGVLLPLPLKDLKESPFNPRQRFLKAEMQELTESIKARGILDNPTVRPIYTIDGDGLLIRGSIDHYRIVKGHRRVRAGIAAGLIETLCMVKEMTDLEEREIQLIELRQSHNPHPLEQAHAYKGLLEAGRTVQEIAAAIGGKGMSASHVYQQIKLCELIPEAQTAFLNNRFTPAHAVPVARLNPVDQKQALTWLLYGYAHNGKKIDVDEGPPTESSVSQLKRWISQNCHLQLSNAPFPLADNLLYEKAGSCTVCSKNTAINRDLFADVPAEAICTDGACFNQKAALFLEEERQRKEKDCGQKVIMVSAVQHPGEGTPGILSAEKWKLANFGDHGQKVIIAEAGYKDGVQFPFASFADVCTDRKCKIHWQKSNASNGTQASPQATALDKCEHVPPDSKPAKISGDREDDKRIRAEIAIRDARVEATRKLSAKARWPLPAADMRVIAESINRELFVNERNLVCDLMEWEQIEPDQVSERISKLSVREFGRWLLVCACLPEITNYDDDPAAPTIQKLAARAKIDLKKLEQTHLEFASGPALDEKQSGALLRALNHFEGGGSRWEKRIKRGMTDDELKAALSEELGLGGGMSGPGLQPVSYKGGSDPRVWFAMTDQGKPALHGKALLQAVRATLRIPRPENTPSKANKDSKPVKPVKPAKAAPKSKPAGKKKGKHGKA